jgi:hypothetical protein
VSGGQKTHGRAHEVKSERYRCREPLSACIGLHSLARGRPLTAPRGMQYQGLADRPPPRFSASLAYAQRLPAPRKSTCGRPHAGRRELERAPESYEVGAVILRQRRVDSVFRRHSNSRRSSRATIKAVGEFTVPRASIPDGDSIAERYPAAGQVKCSEPGFSEGLSDPRRENNSCRGVPAPARVAEGKGWWS